jgi:hypothetical protein
MVPQYFGSLTTGNYVVTQQNDSDFSLVAGVDLPAFWETLKLRWWVIPAVIAVAVGFLWAQESDLQSEPGSYYISETYEARDPTAVLASVGIDPVSVRAFPDANNQLLLLQSASVKAEIAEQVGSNIAVTVSRSRPSFTLVDTLESDGQSSFVFTSAGVPTYSFACNEPAKADCRAAIAAYVAKTTEIRKGALAAGLADLRAVLTRVSEQSDDSNVATKISAIEVLEERLDTPLLKVSEREEAVGPTISTVRRPTYTFGIAGGLLIALLILLQLTYTDSRIRSIRQLSRIVGKDGVLGHVSKASDPLSERRVAVAIHTTPGLRSGTTVRYLPLRQPLLQEGPLQRVAETAQVQSAIALPFSDMSVSALTQPSSSELDVIVVQRNKDLRKDLVEVLAALNRSDRTLAGVLLVD